MKIISNINPDTYNQARLFNNFSVYHSKEWHQLLNKSFGWNIQAITHKDKNDQLVFFLPIIRSRNFKFKIKYTTLPLSHHVPPLLLSSFNPNLLSFSKIGTFNIEIHGEFHHFQANLRSANKISTLYLDGNITEKEIFSKLHKSSIQRKIKKAQKAGIKVYNEINLTSFMEFYDLVVETRQRQGVPTYPKTFFKELYQISQKTSYFKLFMARYNNKPISGVIFSYNSGKATYMYGASLSDQQYLKMGCNQAVMWAAIQDAYSNGFVEIDFGSTPTFHKSLLAYKEKWGAVSTDLFYSYIGKNNHTTGLNRESKLITFTSSILRKMPGSLFKRVTPYILKRVV